MRPLLSLLLLIVISVLVAQMRHAGVDAGMTTAFSVGFLLTGAWITGELFGRARLPRISGYIGFGLLVGPSLWSLLPHPDESSRFAAWLTQSMPLVSSAQTMDLRFIEELAIALIAITAGGEIRVDWLRRQLRQITVLTLVAVPGVTLCMVGGLTLVHALWPTIIAPDGATTVEIVLIIAFLALISSGNSPSIAIALATECRAEGPLTRLTLAVTVCKDLTLLVLFTALLSVGRGVHDEQSTFSAVFLLAVGAQLGGSLIVGAMLGVMMAWLAARLKSHLTLFVVGACFFIALVAEQRVPLELGGEPVQLHLEPLLTALAAGVVMRNFRPEPTVPVFHTIEHLSVPVYCAFFAVAGSKLQLQAFASVTTCLLVGAIVAMRAASIWALIGLTAARLRLDEAWRGRLWMALTPQAGITLALAAILADTFTEAAWSQRLHQLLLALVTVHCLLGPIAYRRALVKSGEVGRASTQHVT